MAEAQEPSPARLRLPGIFRRDTCRDPGTERLVRQSSSGAHQAYEGVPERTSANRSPASRSSQTSRSRSRAARAGPRRQRNRRPSGTGRAWTTAHRAIRAGTDAPGRSPGGSGRAGGRPHLADGARHVPRRDTARDRPVRTRRPPAPRSPPANAAATKQSNVYLYADGASSPATAMSTARTWRSAISKDAQHAALAAEDRDFYTESAVVARRRPCWLTSPPARASSPV